MLCEVVAAGEFVTAAVSVIVEMRILQLRLLLLQMR